MPIRTLFNTTITIKSASRTEDGNQPVQTIGAAGDAISARKEFVEASIIDTAYGEIVQQRFIFYLPKGTTIKEGDIIVEDSTDYKVIAANDAHGMRAIDHIEAWAVKQP